VLDERIVQDVRQHWDEGWNRGDLDTIMAPFAESVVFSSPFVPVMTGDESRRTIEGRPALQSYIADSLRRAPGIRYTVDATFTGLDTLILMYTCRLPDGSNKTGADSMRVGADGKVVEWRCHYTFAPEEVRQLIAD
jgi:hypothetical protein